MITETSIPSTATVSTRYGRELFPSLCWGAIIGGTVAAMGIHILLTALGVGGGLATFSPTTDANPVASFSTGAGIVWSLCALAALFFGGIVAGRFSHTVHSGFVHGVLVWSLTLIITVVLISMGTGMVLGGALKAVGAGVGMAGTAAASSVGDKSVDQIGSFIEEAVQSVPTNSTAKASIRAKREVGFAAGKLFASGNDIDSQENRSALIKALVEYTQMSEADASKTVEDWMVSYKNLKKELAQKAEVAAKNVSCAAVWAFFALLIGLLVSGVGGVIGARCAAKRVVVQTEIRS